MKGWVRRFRNFIFDPSEDVQDRLFILLTVIALTGLLVAVFAGFAFGENLVSLLMTLGSFFIYAAIVFTGYKMHKIRICANILGVVLVYIFFPAVYFTSGGIYGGSPLWFVFAVIYVGMILRGKFRIFCLASEFLITYLCYYLQYHHLVIIIPHSFAEFYSDSLGSFLIVSVMIIILVSFQTYVYRRENDRTRAQKEEIDSLSKAQNQFFSSMSHEIRTPINTIIGLNEMILREEISDEVEEDARNVQAASKMLLNLINDILDLSKIRSGQMKLTLSPYSPAEMIADVVGMIQVRADEKKLEFRVGIPPALPATLLGDEVRIKQILINILNNAVKYTEKGHIALSVECRTNDDKADIIFSISDSGMGIKKENIPYLFTAFRRVDEEKNKHIEGTGLGLSIVKQLTDLMNGKITVNSVYQQGTTFVVQIPQEVIRGEASTDMDILRIKDEQKHSSYSKSFEAPGAKVLIVDDTAANIMVVKKLLRSTLVKIDSASSGQEALKKTLESEYDVILMDHLMPNMDGIECMHLIRQQTGGLCKRAKIVALTANAGREDRELYEREGFDGYMIKPVNGKALEAELIRLLPQELVTVTDKGEIDNDEGSLWVQTHERKKPVMITMTSLADLPRKLIQTFQIGVIPVKIETKQGIFRDGVDLDTDAILSYLEDTGGQVQIRPISTMDFERFFVENLQYANNIIHLSPSGRVADISYKNAQEAKKALENVYIFDTEKISTAQGIMAIEAARLAGNGEGVEEILKRLEQMKDEISTSFVVGTMDNLIQSGQLKRSMEHIIKAFMIRPMLKMNRGRTRVAGVFLGSKERAWRSYIRLSLLNAKTIDDSMLFITHVGLDRRELEFIREEVLKRVDFKNIYVQKASPGIAVNVGKGTFGLLFRRIKKSQ